MKLIFPIIIGVVVFFLSLQLSGYLGSNSNAEFSYYSSIHFSILILTGVVSACTIYIVDALEKLNIVKDKSKDHDICK
ncbi:hypothetical protein N752_05695 [Desulforamulus aquiferis]|nr:hypothetical protein [Desulforamulus aquiferis]RYD06141.1 hypothetical protein N752_05695 [Desulforamulus aquiferis]